MKYILISIFLVVPFLSEAQVILSDGKKLGSVSDIAILDIRENTSSNRIYVYVDGGQKDRLRIQDGKGQNVKFFSVVEVMKFMKKRGWNYKETMSTWGYAESVTAGKSFMKLLFEKQE